MQFLLTNDKYFIYIEYIELMSYLKRVFFSLLFLFSLTLALFFLSAGNVKVLAQESNENQGWFCAKTTWCTGDNYQEGTCTLKSVHRVKLEIDPNNRPVPNNDQTYVVECLSSTTNNNQVEFRCTTGSSDLDLKAFNVDNYSWLKNNWGYTLERTAEYGIYNVENNQATKIGAKEYRTGPSSGLIIKDDNKQVATVEWQSYTPEEKAHKFYFFQKIPSQSNIEPGQGGQQQTTSFDWVNADKDCAIIRWDPAGRVFDALSLEPIPNASVFLTKDKGGGNFVDASQLELGIINPQSTNPQGGFSFYVSDGDYKLNITNLPSLGYQRLADNINEVNSKYNQIYYYLVSGVKRTFIYPSETGEIINQRGKMEYRDLPLISSSGEGKTYPLEVLSAFYTVDKVSKKAIFEGSVSHPFSRVIIYGVLEDINGKENKEMIYQGITDNLGNYKITFSQTADNKIYEYFETEFIKTPLTNISKKDNWFQKTIAWILKKIKPSVLAQTTSGSNKVILRLDPIPTYLEGIARDSSGKILPNSQVKIYIKGINVPYRVVNTDEKGYFKVSSSSLPSFPYEIKYQDSFGKTVTVSTSKFIADNRDLILSKNINLYSLKDSQGKSIALTSPTTAKSSSGFPMENLRERNKEPKTNTLPQRQNSGIILILAIIFFLLILAGVLVYFYFRGKKSSSLV